MSYIAVCDLCGKPLKDGLSSARFKVKKLNASWDEHWWQKIDVHEECVQKLLNGVHKTADCESCVFYRKSEGEVDINIISCAAGNEIGKECRWYQPV